MPQHRSFRLTIEPDEDPAGVSSRSVGKRWAEAIFVAAVQQALILIVASLILDGGRVFFFCAGAAIASWVLILMILVRRWKQPTAMDLMLVKYGFWLAIPLIMVIMMIATFLASLLA